MGNQYVGNAATFLIETVFGLYILIVMLRFLLQWVRADFYNQISQFVVKATQPALHPLRRIIPGFKGVDLAAVALMLGLQLIEEMLVRNVLGFSPNVVGVLVFSLAELLRLLVNVFFWAIFIQIIISWVNPGAHNPVTSLLHSLTEPLLRPARRMLPPTAGFDLSPIPVLIVLQLCQFLIVAPIRDIGAGLM